MDRIKFSTGGQLILVGKDFQPIDVADADVKYCISQSVPYSQKQFTHLDILAPSKPLIFGFWNKSLKDSAAEMEYKRRWDIEKDSNKEYWDWIYYIAGLLYEGKVVVLGCWCMVPFCHRFIVADDIMGILWALIEQGGE